MVAEPNTPAPDEMLMMLPPVFFSIMTSAAALENRNVPFRLIATIAANPLGEISCAWATKLAPALLIRISTCPQFSTVFCTTASTWSFWRTSQTSASTSPPVLRIPSATGPRWSMVRLVIITLAPRRQNSAAISAPMPVPPPVTMVVLPAMSNASSVMGSLSHVSNRSRLL